MPDPAEAREVRGERSNAREATAGTRRRPASHRRRGSTRSTLSGTFPYVIRDTTADALREQTRAQRRLGAAGRLRTACWMSQSIADLAKARIRARHPEFDERAVIAELILERHGVRTDA